MLISGYDIHFITCLLSRVWYWNGMVLCCRQGLLSRGTAVDDCCLHLPWTHWCGSIQLPVSRLISFLASIFSRSNVSRRLWPVETLVCEFHYYFVVTWSCHKRCCVIVTSLCLYLCVSQYCLCYTLYYAKSCSLIFVKFWNMFKFSLLHFRVCQLSQNFT